MSAPTNARCSERVYGHGHGFSGSPCSKTPKVERDGKWYCTTHDPEAVRARRAKLQEKWDREAAIRSAGYRIVKCERAVLDAVLAGTDLTAPRQALLNAIAARDALEYGSRAVDVSEQREKTT